MHIVIVLLSYNSFVLIKGHSMKCFILSATYSFYPGLIDRHSCQGG
jgi:hypothetical protein